MNFIGPMIRSKGQSIIKLASRFTGPHYYRDKCLIFFPIFIIVVPSLRGRPFNNAVVENKNAEWIAPNSVIIGDVTVGERSSLWHGVIARGDLSKIMIGKNVVIQDLTILANSLPRDEENKGLQKENEGKTIIKDDVVIGPQCTIGKATIESRAYISSKATVSDGCIVESYAILAGGAYLPPNMVVPSGQVWAGNPAKYLRDVTIEEKLAMSENLEQLISLSKIYAEETEKTPKEALISKCEAISVADMEEINLIVRKLWEKGYPVTQEDLYYAEHRVSGYGSDALNNEDPNFRELHQEKDYYERSWEPLSYDIEKMTSVLKKYGVNTDMYEEAYQRFKHEPKGIEREAEGADETLPKDQSPWEKKYDNVRRFKTPSIS